VSGTSALSQLSLSYRTCHLHSGTSHSSEFLTHALQQTPVLFDHLVGPREQRWRDGNAERLRGLQVDNQLKFGRLLDR
jgi:hypothetical protein